ncbi:MAG: helix-turn-helix domain-containing protein [Candidatus Aenigmatarchaeota archaeon]
MPGFCQIFQYSVDADILENNTVNYKINLIYVNNPEQNVSFTLGSPSNISIETKADCKIVKRVLGTVVTCDMDASNRTDIQVLYSSDENVKKREGYLLFSDSFVLDDDVNTLSVLVKLPEATGLREPIENSYSPSDALKGSDGRRLIINWLKNDLDVGERFDVSIAFDSTGEVIAGLPMQYLLVIVVITFSGFVLFYQFYLKGKGIKFIIPVLKKDEKTIFNTIMKHGSGVNQKIIVRDSGYSKAKVSKVLSSLKERGLVKLERIGRSNKVYIVKDFQKKP